MRTFVSLAAAAAFTAFLSVGVSVPPTSAATIVFELDEEFSGATEPEGTPPWIIATFTDIVGGVSLIIEAVNLSATEFLSAFAFNVNDIDVTVTAGDPINPSAPDATVLFDRTADGAGVFDVFLDFPTSGDTFGDGEFSTWIIEGLLTTADILSLSTSQQGNTTDKSQYVAAHIQGINEADSGWITGDPGDTPPPIPLPAGLLLFLTGLTGIGFLGRFKAKRQEPVTA